MSLIKKSLNKIKTFFLVACASLSQSVFAALPDTQDPTNAAADGDYIGLAKGYAFDIIVMVGLVIAAVGFTIVSKNMLACYSEIGAGKKTWGDLGMQASVGVVLLVIIVYLLTEAAGIIF